MAYTYTRTITTSPEGVDYTWTNPASSWITIEQQGTSDSWNITIEENTSGARSATLTVTHDDGVTTDTINVSQAGATVNPTATPVPPTATATATPVPPTPTPTTSSSAFTMTSNTTSGTAVDISNATSSSPATVTYEIVVSGMSPTAPVVTTAPSLINPGGWQVNTPTAGLENLETGQTTWTGTIDVWKAISNISTMTQEVVVSWGGETDSFYVTATGAVDDGGGGVDDGGGDDRGDFING